LYLKWVSICAEAVTVDVDLALNERRHVHLASDSYCFGDVRTDPHLPSQIGLRHHAPGILDQILQHRRATEIPSGLARLQHEQHLNSSLLDLCRI
jgi:hypothetical protein